MITFLTGAPGGGKTLYTVWHLLRQLVGTTVQEEMDDGTHVTHKRTIYTNIRGLLLDHELIDANNLHNWWEWAQPGSVIVFDEVQKAWPPRPNGSKRPQDVSELEEHRGKWSVDFIIISQHPMLVDRDVQNLVGRHIHLRRVANWPLSIAYEWDMISRTLAFKTSVSKSFVWFSRQAYKLYKSARVHTKQPKKVPTLVYVILGALALAAWKIPESYSRITGKQVAAFNPDTYRPAKEASSAPASASSTHAPAVPVAAASAPAAPVLAGCSVFRGACSCHDQYGMRIEVETKVCTGWTDFGPIKATTPGQPRAVQVEMVPSLAEVLRSRVSHDHAADYEALAFMAQRR
ncbi:zonular occludens toxin domain-containing protein [Variovorax terrae]|uniref:Zonular occludens toxin domain-containing protein n=1 Tax=Variovorax terrae TaxID=2923278 RepID=A0A9X2APF4_9BURK|nr:zonular occludens toxin domain-containing protein [Variovorax terrae]MCJ0765334.1 zonular occludens toxin domain-containing protein [Variovorax terrae]